MALLTNDSGLRQSGAMWVRLYDITLDGMGKEKHHSRDVILNETEIVVYSFQTSSTSI